jgi:hypothetical protein
MSQAQSNVIVPLIDSGLPREELEMAIAHLYMTRMKERVSSHSDTVQEWHVEYAKAILDRSFYRLEFITNGLNVTGKKVFCEVTGVKLPAANGASRKMLLEWTGTDPLQDAILEARRVLKIWYDNAARQLSNMDVVVKKVEECYAAGLVQLIKVNKAYYIANPAGTSGFNTSEKGFRGGLVRPYIEAFLKLQKLRVEAGEIQEPVWVDPTPAPAPAPAPAKNADAASPTQSGFGF